MATSSIQGQPKVTADDALLTGYLLALRANGRKDKTQDTYRESVKALQRFLEERAMPPLAQVTTEHLREFFNSLYERGNKPATVSVRYRALRRFFAWLLDEGERADNPMDRIPPPRLPDVLQPHYLPDDLKKVLAACPATSRDQLALRNRAMLLTLVDSGMRTSELCGARVDDLDLRALSLVVRQPKGGRERAVGLGGIAAQSIERYLRRRQTATPFLFASANGRPLNYNAVHQVIHRLFQAAGVSFNGLHGLRRTWAMAFLDAGGDPADLQTLAGWTSPAMLRRYTRATERERALKAHRRFSPVDTMGLGR
jgi:site-specific recombinase XerD